MTLTLEQKDIRYAAVVVTYNRKELVSRNIEAVLSQTFAVEKIIVVNNSSTDGTSDYLKEKFGGNNKIEIYELDNNYGGAGGFYYGLKYAVECGYDRIILMDDDGRPYNDRCFERLIDAVSDEPIGSMLMVNSLVVCSDEKLTFGIKHSLSVSDAVSAATDNKIVGEINPFNGTLVSRSLTEKIGYPNKDFFIKGDEVDYYLRALSADAKVFTVTDSLYYHPAPIGMEKKRIMGKTVFLYVEPPLKEYYTVRNRTYALRCLNRKFDAFKFLMKNIARILLVKCKKRDIWRAMIKGYKDGKRGRLGKVNF